MNRLKSLDATRGFAVLAMVPFHVFVFGGWVMGLFGGGEDQASTVSELPLIQLYPPLATGLLIFFFVTGMSLAVSLAARREKQSGFAITRHVVLRYGSYIILGIATELLMGYLIWKTGVFDSFLNILEGSGISAPIVGLAFSAIIAFPLILKLSWKKLVGMSLALALIVGVVLYYVVLPQALSFLPPLENPSWLGLLLTSWFGILKGVPVVLFGAAVGKLMVDGWDLRKKFLLVGLVITAVYFVVPTLFGTGMLHMLLVVWTYDHAFIFILGAGLLLLALMWTLEARNVNLSPFTVLGRLSIFTYFGHMYIDFVLMTLIGVENLTVGLILGLMIGVTAAIWVIFYFYSKWRWGPPSTW